MLFSRARNIGHGSSDAAWHPDDENVAGRKPSGCCATSTLARQQLTGPADHAPDDSRLARCRTKAGFL